nr:hypothetical protein [Tanacetum cinerariifolium]
MRIGAAAKARAIDMPVEMPSCRSWYDGAAALLSRATESRAPSKGSQKNRSVTSGKGLALRARYGGPNLEPSAVDGLLELNPSAGKEDPVELDSSPTLSKALPLFLVSRLVSAGQSRRKTLSGGEFGWVGTSIKRLLGIKCTRHSHYQVKCSHWQYQFPLPVKVVATVKRLEMPLPEVWTAIKEKKKKLPIKDRWQLH